MNRPAMEERLNSIVLSLNFTMKRKLSILYEIHNHTSQEYNCVSEENLEQLGSLLKEKQELMSEIDYLDRKFLVEFDELKKELGVSSLENIDMEGNSSLDSLKLNTEEILDILKKIERLDKKVQQKISKLRNDITMEMTKIKKHKQVNKIYNDENAKSVMRDFGVYDISKRSSFDKKK